MKLQRTFMAMATLVIVALSSGCKSNDPMGPASSADVSIAKTPEFRISSGDNILAQSPNAPAAPAIRRAPASPAGALTYNTISYTWESPIDVFAHFPEFVTPEGYFDDFLFESNGEPFDLVMLYSNGGYRHLMGIYWYEDGEYHEQQLWDEREDIKAHTWVNFNGADSKGAISRKSDNAGAYTIQLPKGIKYGFFCHSLLNDEEIKEGIRTPLPFGPIVGYTYLFYTEKEKNWSYTVAVYDKYAEQGKTVTQAMTTSAGDWTIVGFEDRSITHPGCDRDYNDCVFAMNPRQRIEGEEPVKPTADCVEVNLSVNDEHATGDFVATKLSIHVRSITDVEVFLPIDKQYYCEADDMDISLSHREPNMVYNTDPQYVEMTLADTKVTFEVRYEDEGIYVTTDGINQAVIDYCNETYGDGITFEVWNYFKDITREALKPMLDQSMVLFLDQNPALYINAFAKERGYEGPVYSKMENGQLFPYTDEACTILLDEQFWTRTSPDAKDYIFIGAKNAWDCVVTPAESAYTALVPIGTDSTLPDYNVKYSL